MWFECTLELKKKQGIVILLLSLVYSNVFERRRMFDSSLVCLKFSCDYGWAMPSLYDTIHRVCTETLCVAIVHFSQ